MHSVAASRIRPGQFYVHCVDEDFGAFFLKFSSYFPYGARLLVNGHHYAQVLTA